MLFKSVKSSLSTKLALGSILFSSSAWATLTVTPIRYDTQTITANTTTLASTPTAYYAASLTTTTPPGLDSNDPTVPLAVDTSSQTSDTTGVKAMYFNVSSSTGTFSQPSGGSGYTSYIMAFVVPLGTTTTSGAFPIPIGYVTQPNTNLQGCNNSPSPCTLNEAGSNPNYFYAVPYTPGTTVQIGIYPTDICNVWGTGSTLGSTGSPGAPCTTSGVSAPYTAMFQVPAANSSTGFTLKFYIAMINPNNASGFTRNTGTDTSLTGGTGIVSLLSSEEATYALSFQSSAGTITSGTCPNQVGLYIPGDQSIYLDTTQFSYKFVPPVGGTAGGSGFAPAGSLVATYFDSGSTAVNYQSVLTQPKPNDGASFPNPTDPVLSRNIPLGVQQQQIGAGVIQNSIKNPGGAAPTYHYYDLQIYIRDLAGLVTTNGCALDNVVASQIQGFLNSSKCFIATAAYRSGDAAPVRMLRQFRDQVLLHFELGKRFVHWYYNWSPPAAEWLMDHPDFRYPVLIALVPVEIIAWLCLKPLVFLALVATLFAAFFMYRKRTAATQGESA